jgi:hypothetical protein
VEAAKATLGQLLTQQAALDPLNRLGSFLQERVQSTVYRSQQGIISLVHKDFRELSRYMRALREARLNDPKTPLEPGAITPFDRIVIYVDDLDRCRPDHVVHMLEAIHLLLALDLFVVVVAVDARWLTRALEVHYKDLLTSGEAHERAATPLNYLEKIFQITYALGPMRPEYFADYVASLSGHGTPTVSVHGQTTSGMGTAHARNTPDMPTPQRPELQADAPEAPHTHAPANDTKLADRKTEVPLPVRLDATEQRLLAELVPLLPTPRIAKRLVNVYRLLKANLDADVHATSEANGRARSRLLMLAIMFGRPTLAVSLLRMLHERCAPFDEAGLALHTAIAKHATLAQPERMIVEWTELSRVLARVASDVTIEHCMREPLEIARYSLIFGNDWHAWTSRGS